jgi:deazaflavin-dependent oxidoreductase (nitroreductase family)
VRILPHRAAPNDAHPRGHTMDDYSTSYLYLTTRGHKTGLSREIEIWFTERGSCFYLIAEYPNSHWVENLRAHAEVQVRVAGKSFAAHARVLSLETDAQLLAEIQKLSHQKYGWGEGLVVELDPDLKPQPSSAVAAQAKSEREK